MINNNIMLLQLGERLKEASSILGRLDGWQEVFATKEDLFAKFKRKSVSGSAPEESERKKHDAHDMVNSAGI